MSSELCKGQCQQEESSNHSLSESSGYQKFINFIPFLLLYLYPLPSIFLQFWFKNVFGHQKKWVICMKHYLIGKNIVGVDNDILFLFFHQWICLPLTSYTLRHMFLLSLSLSFVSTSPCFLVHSDLWTTSPLPAPRPDVWIWIIVTQGTQLLLSISHWFAHM